ncbi:DUF4148 domain-containing protein [Caldimonas brevitalea]|nr:DUF4148 domain-containing protein [Caldimonas brevitalea]
MQLLLHRVNFLAVAVLVGRSWCIRALNTCHFCNDPLKRRPFFARPFISKVHPIDEHKRITLATQRWARRLTRPTRTYHLIEERSSTMNVQKNLIVAVIATFAAAGAFAQEATPEDDNFHAQYASLKTRAQVKAELLQARADQPLVVHSGEASMSPMTARSAVTRSRDDVKRETISALRSDRAEAPINIGG